MKCFCYPSPKKGSGVGMVGTNNYFSKAPENRPPPRCPTEIVPPCFLKVRCPKIVLPAPANSPFSENPPAWGCTTSCSCPSLLSKTKIINIFILCILGFACRLARKGAGA